MMSEMEASRARAGAQETCIPNPPPLWRPNPPPLWRVLTSRASEVAQPVIYETKQSGGMNYR